MILPKNRYTVIQKVMDKKERENENKKSGRIIFQILTSKSYSFIPFLLDLHIEKHSEKEHLKPHAQYKETKQRVVGRKRILQQDLQKAPKS